MTHYVSPMYAKQLETSENSKANLGSFSIPNFSELYCIGVFVFNEMSSGNIRCNLYSSDAFITPIASSEWELLDSIPNSYCDFIYFTFNRVSLNPNIIYYLQVEADNYTDSEASWIGLVYDFPERTYGIVSNNVLGNPIKFEIILYDK